MVRKDCTHQLLRNFSKDCSRRNRRIERGRACDRVEIGEANADRYGSARPRFGSQSGSNPIREMTQCGSQRSLFRGLPAEC